MKHIPENHKCYLYKARSADGALLHAHETKTESKVVSLRGGYERRLTVGVISNELHMIFHSFWLKN